MAEQISRFGGLLVPEVIDQSWLRKEVNSMICKLRGHRYDPSYLETFIRARNNGVRKVFIYTCRCCGTDEVVRARDHALFIKWARPRWGK